MSRIRNLYMWNAGPIKVSIGISILCFIFFLHTNMAAAAPKPDRITGIKVGESTAIFLIEITLGSAKSMATIPATTLRTTSDEMDPMRTHYYIENEDGEVVEHGTSTALLLSDASIEDGRYTIPAGESRTFTLLTLFSTEVDDEYRARFRTLPFALASIPDEDLQYNRHELKYYASPYLELNDD